MRTMRFLASLAAAVLVAGCNDFLTGGELSNDPNRPLSASSDRLFVAIQSQTWALMQSDLARIAGMFTQQWEGTDRQYQAIYNYNYSESTTNGFHAGLYTGGGLVDIRQLQANARAASDSFLLGVAQVQEALTMGTGADIFGDLTYTQALSRTTNPPLDPQMAVYDSVQALLGRAIANLSATGATNRGPGSADLVYGGNRAAWLRLAHTLRARFFMHVAEVRPGAYAQALTEARQGITSTSGDYVEVFSGNANEQNFWYQFIEVQRSGYIAPNPYLYDLMESRGDPRLTDYFTPGGGDLSKTRRASNYTQHVITAQENLLTWAEAAYRTGNESEARAQLDAEHQLVGLPAVPATLSGTALLREILTERYIALFQTIEVWNDYKRTCFPNLVPVVSGQKIPARLYYDTSERQTNSNIPPGSGQPTRNANDPANATDPFGNKCLGQ
ncbi:MAG: SusD/RagB family nutrient-binding outer membrane lipoprotein [Gemmatimonadaceae bacterium]